MNLNPLPNSSLLKTMVGDIFSREECERIIGALDGPAWRPAAITNDDHPGGVVDLYTRSVLTQNVPIFQGGWPLSAIRDVITEINDSVWRFDLTGYLPHDYPNVLRYEAGANDHFHTHSDVGAAHPTRKLSFSVQLTDPATYRGAELLFNGNSRDLNMRQLGTITVFPSILLHEVTPVIQGTREAIVGWVHGPSFR